MRMKHTWLFISLISFCHLSLAATGSSETINPTDLAMITKTVVYNHEHKDIEPLVETAMRLQDLLFDRNILSSRAVKSDEKKWHKFLQSVKDYIQKKKNLVDLDAITIKRMYKDLIAMLADLDNISNEITKCSRTIFVNAIAPAFKNKKDKQKGVETITAENTNLSKLGMSSMQRNVEKLSRNKRAITNIKLELKEMQEQGINGTSHILFVVAMILDNAINKMVLDYEHLEQYVATHSSKPIAILHKSS